jgi:hypothetical protein
MAANDHVEAPAVRDCLALSELREFARCAPHMSFDLAIRRAIIDALRIAANEAASRSTGSVAASARSDSGSKGHVR